METVDSIGVYWGPRRETVGECAARLSAYLLGLSKEHVLLSTWYLKQRSRKAEPVPVPFQDSGSAELLALIAAGANRRDIGQDVIESLGFRISLWNGLDDEQSFGLSIKCGLFDQSSGLGNAAVLTLPSESEDAVIVDRAVLKRILLRGIEAWQPDWGAVFFSGSSALENRVGNAPFLDQALWVKEEKFPIEGNAVKRESILAGTLLERT